MLTAARADRLIIISDLHLGNPFSKSRERALQFLRWAASRDYDLCINGDGLEIAQSSFMKMAMEVPEVFRTLREIGRRGKNVYYVVGNHDIALEHFLEDWGIMKVCPFLNLESGNLRIRVEHGHLYDPFFVNYPRLYEVLTRFGGVLLAIHPEIYRLWIALEKFRARLRARRTGILGEPPEFAEAAREICNRGFDAVVFGHTHHRGEVDLGEGKRYLNSGSWLVGSDYIRVENNQIQLLSWPEPPEGTT